MTFFSSDKLFVQHINVSSDTPPTELWAVYLGSHDPPWWLIRYFHRYLMLAIQELSPLNDGLSSDESLRRYIEY